MKKTTLAVIYLLGAITLPSQKALAMDSEKMPFQLWTGPEIPSDPGEIPFAEGVEHRTEGDMEHLTAVKEIQNRGKFSVR